MKGVVFTEFLGFVAEHHGEDMVDDIIEDCALPSGGAYTGVGTYAHQEMGMLCAALAARTGEPAADLVCSFGSHLSGSFAQHHPAHFSRATNFFDFLESIEGHIHVDVLKLYPDAELPKFSVEERSPTRLVMLYSSPRRMSALAVGLIGGSAKRFGIEAKVSTAEVAGSDGATVRLVIDIA